MEYHSVELLFGVCAVLLAIFCCCSSRKSTPESATGSNPNQDQPTGYPESSAAIGDFSKTKSLNVQIVKTNVELVPDEASVMMVNVNTESSDANQLTNEVVETKQLQSGNKHQWEIDYQCNNGNALMPPENRLHQLEAKLNELLSENTELKNRNRALAIDLENVTWQRNDFDSGRQLLETKVKTLQEECYQYRRLAEDALLKYSRLQASSEKEMEEFETRLELSETKAARCKINFQKLQGALTAEIMRTAVHAKAEQNARQALSYNNVKIRKLEAQNARQGIRIAELEAGMGFESRKPVSTRAQPGVKARTPDSNFKMFKTKICTAMTPALKEIRSIYPSKISNWLTRPVRVFSTL